MHLPPKGGTHVIMRKEGTLPSTARLFAHEETKGGDAEAPPPSRMPGLTTFAKATVVRRSFSGDGRPGLRQEGRRNAHYFAAARR
jgi:hypothetical protein